MQVWTRINPTNSTFFRPQAQENVDVFSQRWFYGGKLLGDKTSLEEAKVQPGYIIQVIINTEKHHAGS